MAETFVDPGNLNDRTRLQQNLCEKETLKKSYILWVTEKYFDDFLMSDKKEPFSGNRE